MNAALQHSVVFMNKPNYYPQNFTAGQLYLYGIKICISAVWLFLPILKNEVASNVRKS